MAGRASFEAAKRAITFSFENGTSLCDPFLSVIPVSGAAISVLATPAAQTTMCASDGLAARLDELQFDLGEGPCWEAMGSNLPVLHPDIRAGDGAAWPEFDEAVRREAVGAMFAFPMVVGALEIGAVDLYTSSPGTLTNAELADAATLAKLASWQVLRRILAANDGHDDTEEESHSRREIHQATGMVLAQLEVTAEDAALLLRAHAFSSGRTVREIANDVVERRLDFSLGSDSRPGLGRE
jgi:hypothetical protein